MLFMWCKIYNNLQKMIFIEKPEAKLILQKGASLDDIYEHIDKCARVSYKSEPKGNSRAFVHKLIKAKHMSVLEHGTVYLSTNDCNMRERYMSNPYSFVHINDESGFSTITTNYRVIKENGWEGDFAELDFNSDFQERRLSILVTTDIGTSRELNRHRAFSITEQSTRYCNFSKAKFGEELTFLTPPWYKGDDKASMSFEEACSNAESDYMSLIDFGWTAQQAREVLPLSLVTRVVYTGTYTQFRKLIDMRKYGSTGKPHPNCVNTADAIEKVLDEWVSLNNK